MSHLHYFQIVQPSRDNSKFSYEVEALKIFSYPLPYLSLSNGVKISLSADLIRLTIRRFFNALAILIQCITGLPLRGAPVACHGAARTALHRLSIGVAVLGSFAAYIDSVVSSCHATYSSSP